MTFGSRSWSSGSLPLGKLAVAAAWVIATTVPALSSGFTERLTIVNNCAVDAWMIETPPGSPEQKQVQAQWDWWKDDVGVQRLLKAGEKLPISVPNKGAPGGNLRFFMGCDTGSPTNCIIGASSGNFAAINTLFEPTFGCDPALSGKECAFNPSSPADKYPDCATQPSASNCGPIGSSDYYDISAVAGYTIPMKVDVAGSGCNRQSTDASMLDLAKCPAETSQTLYSTNPKQQGAIEDGVQLVSKDADGNYKACASPSIWFSTAGVGSPANPDPTAFTGCNSGSYYGCAGKCTTSQPPRCPGCSGTRCMVGPKFNGTFAIESTNYVTGLKALGYKGYTWAYDDAEGLQQCKWGAQVTLTLCPDGGTPYEP